MKFRSQVAGYILGVRFYKDSKNIGTHTGSLWTKGGTLLATVTFSNETASGWQQANFSKPVAIAANTIYVVSYWSPASHNSFADKGFASSITNGPLYALKDGEDGGNGLYFYTRSTFPVSSWRSTNYWVDVVFNTTASATSTALPTSMSTGPTATPSVQRAVSLTSSKATESAAPKARSLRCEPQSVPAGGSFSCQLQLGVNGDAFSIPVAASSSEVRLPATVLARNQQQFLTFHGSVDKAASQSTFTVTAGDDSNLVEDQITVLPALAPVFSLPETQTVKSGQPIAFQVAARDPSGFPVQISAPKLPLGASLDQDSARFEWFPALNQQGHHTLTFTAVNSSGQASEGQAQIRIEPDQPVIPHANRAICSPGSVATLEGRWLSLADEVLADPSGASLELGGTRVRVNGGFAPVLFASPTRVDFLCPSLAPETGLEIAIETSSGSTAPIQSTMLAANPALLRAQNLGRKQALATIAGTDRIAAVREYHGVGEPAQRDDVVSFRATGLGTADSYAGLLHVQIGGMDAPVEAVVLAPDAAGVFLIRVRIPVSAPLGDEVPVRLELVTADGQRLASNTVTLAIE